MLSSSPSLADRPRSSTESAASGDENGTVRASAFARPVSSSRLCRATATGALQSLSTGLKSLRQRRTRRSPRMGGTATLSVEAVARRNDPIRTPGRHAVEGLRPRRQAHLHPAFQRCPPRGGGDADRVQRHLILGPNGYPPARSTGAVSGTGMSWRLSTGTVIVMALGLQGGLIPPISIASRYF